MQGGLNAFKNMSSSLLMMNSQLGQSFPRGQAPLACLLVPALALVFRL